jgi:ABC-type antimicrobial peptide transport system permease subunit
VECFGTIFAPASRAFLPAVASEAELTEANGLVQAGWTAAAFVGSPVGGFLVVAVGVVSGLVYNALTYAVSAALISAISISAIARTQRVGPTEEPASLLSDVGAGFRYLRSETALLAITLAAMVSNFFGSMYLAYIVVYNGTILHGSGVVFGVLLGAETLGFGLGSFLTGRLRTDRSPGIWSMAAWGLSGVPMVAVVFLPFVPAAVALMAAQQFLSAVGNTTWLTAVQRTVPTEYLGRYFATDQAGSFAMVPLGILVGGFLLVVIGTGAVFVLAGAGTVASGLGTLAVGAVRRWGTGPARTAPS